CTRTLPTSRLPARVFLSISPQPPYSTLFPYTTLFRSLRSSVVCPPLLLPNALRARARAAHARGRARRRRDPRVPRPASSRTRGPDRKSTRLNSSHSQISYAVFCLKKKKKKDHEYSAVT